MMNARAMQIRRKTNYREKQIRARMSHVILMIRSIPLNLRWPVERPCEEHDSVRVRLSQTNHLNFR